MGRVVHGITEKRIHEQTRLARLVDVVAARPTQQNHRHSLRKLFVAHYIDENVQGPLTNPFALALGTAGFSFVQQDADGVRAQT